VQKQYGLFSSKPKYIPKLKFYLIVCITLILYSFIVKYLINVQLYMKQNAQHYCTSGVASYVMNNCFFDVLYVLHRHVYLQFMTWTCMV
jgi:hypothetical protein